MSEYNISNISLVCSREFHEELRRLKPRELSLRKWIIQILEHHVRQIESACPAIAPTLQTEPDNHWRPEGDPYAIK